MLRKLSSDVSQRALGRKLNLQLSCCFRPELCLPYLRLVIANTSTGETFLFNQLDWEDCSDAQLLDSVDHSVGLEAFLVIEKDDLVRNSKY